MNGDAPEIDHEEIIWNMTTELIDRVDKAFDRVQARIKAGLDEGDLINDEVVDSVNILRTLRHYVREVARREEICHLVKGVKKSSDEHDFSTLVDDVDMVRHSHAFLYPRLLGLTTISLITISLLSACMSSVIGNQKSFLRLSNVRGKPSLTSSHRKIARVSSLVIKASSALAASPLWPLVLH